MLRFLAFFLLFITICKRRSSCLVCMKSRTNITNVIRNVSVINIIYGKTRQLLLGVHHACEQSWYELWKNLQKKRNKVVVFGERERERERERDRGEKKGGEKRKDTVSKEYKKTKIYKYL
jgi:hypothetical protein